MGTKGKKRKDRKGKKTRKPSVKVKKGSLYKIEGEKITRTKKFCPKCGAGIFMAEHKDRFACGKCGYMEKK
jgi:small subunit ribosomal protein S27Ae